MSEVVRLRGEDGDVVAVADAALRSVGSSHPEWVAGVRRLHMMRRQLMSQLGAAEHSARAVAHEPVQQRPLAIAWWIALGVGVAATVTGSAPMLPPRHPQSPELIMAIAPPAIGIAAALLLLAALTLPRSARGQYAVALAAISGLFALAALAINLFRGDALVDAGGSTGTAVWALGAAVVVIASVVLGLRASRGGRPGRDRDGGGSGGAWRSAAVELRGDAKRLLRRAPSDASAQDRWVRELAGLERTVAAESLAHASELGPWSWLVWSAYDGDLRLPQLLAR